MATDRQIDIVTKHYIIAALWADCEEGTHPKVPKAEAAAAREICKAFIEQCEKSEHGDLFAKAMACHGDGYGQHSDAGSAEAAFGHDAWLTRQGHGVGFWDRQSEGIPKELGDLLTAECKKFGENYCHEQYRGWWYFNETLESRKADEERRKAFKL